MSHILKIHLTWKLNLRRSFLYSVFKEKIWVIILIAYYLINCKITRRTKNCGYSISIQTNTK